MNLAELNMRYRTLDRPAVSLDEIEDAPRSPLDEVLPPKPFPCRLTTVWGKFGAPDRYYVNGREISKELHDGWFPKKEGMPYVPPCEDSWRNRASIAMAVHPKQVEEAKRLAKLNGCNTDYRKSGEPMIKDRGHYKRHQKAMGFVDLTDGRADAAKRALKRGRQQEMLRNR